ncbi:MAG TPA: histidinol-phosphatase, partial [Puia sp.]|nr:histidinol-phosphatase [Puia sp.]
MKRILFIDRDGTLINEAPPSYQVDRFSKLAFYPHMFEFMGRIAREFDYELVMVTNQDGLGTAKFPEDTFWPVHDFVMHCLEQEDIRFSAVHIDKTLPEQHAPTRKPGTGMLTDYLNNPEYDIPNSYVIGDRITDVQLALNLGCRALWLNNDPGLGGREVSHSRAELNKVIALETTAWADIYAFLKMGLRQVTHQRNTSETKISIHVNMDGNGKASIHTGLGFFDHMLEQIARHGKMDLDISVQGDLQVDEHHTIEDTAIALGEAFALALADKRGMERYGFVLPM